MCFTFHADLTDVRNKPENVLSYKLQIYNCLVSETITMRLSSGVCTFTSTVRTEKNYNSQTAKVIGKKKALYMKINLTHTIHDRYDHLQQSQLTSHKIILMLHFYLSLFFFFFFGVFSPRLPYQIGYLPLVTTSVTSPSPSQMPTLN